MNGKEYFRTVKTYLTSNYQEDIFSLILFGSMIDSVKIENTHTDVDLIVILKDSCPKETFQKIQRELISIQQSYFPRKITFWGLFFEGLQNATGMFVNSFICYYSDFSEQNFAKVFNVNPLIASLLAPRASVWRSLKHRHLVVLGQDPFTKWIEIPSISQKDIIRSFCLNFLLAIGSLVLGTIARNTTQFAMESVKWSLYTWWNCSNNHSLIEIPKMCGIYAKHASFLEKLTITFFLSYRESGKPSPYLRMLSPLFVLILHKNLLQLN